MIADAFRHTRGPATSETQKIIEPEDPAGEQIEDKEITKCQNSDSSKVGVTHALMSLAPRCARAHASFLSSEAGRRDRRVGRPARIESATLHYLGGECGHKFKSRMPRRGLCAAACCRQGSVATHCAKNQTFHPQSVERSLPRRRLWVRGSFSLGTGTLRDYNPLATRTGDRETWGRPAHALKTWPITAVFGSSETAGGHLSCPLLAPLPGAQRYL